MFLFWQTHGAALPPLPAPYFSELASLIKSLPVEDILLTSSASIADDKIYGIAVFDSDKQPTWENYPGGEYAWRGQVHEESLNKWLETVFCAFGHLRSKHADLRGCRVIDKSRGNSPMIQVQYWVSGQNKQVQRFLRGLPMPSAAQQFGYMSHESKQQALGRRNQVSCDSAPKTKS